MLLTHRSRKMHIASSAIQSLFSNCTLQLYDYLFSRYRAFERTNVGLIERKNFAIHLFIIHFAIGFVMSLEGSRGHDNNWNYEEYSWDAEPGYFAQRIITPTSDERRGNLDVAHLHCKKIRDGQFVTFSNAFASDSRVIRDGGGFPSSTEFNVSLSHGVETRDTVSEVRWGRWRYV